SVSNDTAGWAELVARLRPLTVSAIGLEPSGGYERGRRQRAVTRERPPGTADIGHGWYRAPSPHRSSVLRTRPAPARVGGRQPQRPGTRIRSARRGGRGTTATARTPGRSAAVAILLAGSPRSRLSGCAARNRRAAGGLPGPRVPPTPRRPPCRRP